MRVWCLFYDLWQGTVLSSCTNCNKLRAAYKAGNLQRFRHLQLVQTNWVPRSSDTSRKGRL